MRFPRVGDDFLDRYEIVRVLGEGGFARVFEAIERSIGRRVALKVLKPRGGNYDPGVRARFDREVRSIANLNDPHTVTVFDWGETEDGLLYMVFEFVGGQDLVQILEGTHTLDEASTVKIMRQVLSSLREAHEHGLLHRDIKPHNIRVYEYAGDPLCVKLLDFGIAKPLQGGQAITTEGVLVGTPRYMAPEHLLERPLSPASDIYSLGLVAYEMLLGRDALQGSGLFHQLERVESDDALQLGPDAPVSAALREVLNGMLSPEPSARFQTADAVLAALDQHVADTRPMRAPPPHPTRHPRADERVGGPATSGPPQAEPAPSSDDGGSITPWLLLAGVALTVITGIAVFGPEDSEERATLASPKTPTALLKPTTSHEPSRSPDASSGTNDLRDEQLPSGCGLEPPFIGRGRMRQLDALHELTWSAYVPASYDPQVRHPVLMLFHEDMDSPAQTLNMTGFDRFADERDIVILMPTDDAVRAWRSIAEVRPAQRILEFASQRLCLDADAGVYAFGHGTGGRAVERLPCVVDVKAAAVSAHRPETTDTFCTPVKPLPYLHIAPLNDGYDPVEGGSQCGAAKISLAELEKRWLQRNACSEHADVRRHRGGTCREYECEVPFTTCHARGGHRWPGQKHRSADVQGCDGGAMELPIAEIVWKFFDSISG